MPTDYPSEKKADTKFDRMSLLGVLGALMILAATTISYLVNNLETKEQASLRTYLKTGISPPR